MLDVTKEAVGIRLPTLLFACNILVRRHPVQADKL